MKIFPGLFLALIVIACSQAPATAQSDTNLRNKRISLHVEQGSLGQVFDRLIGDYGVAIGLEESTYDREHNDYDFATVTPAAGDHRILDKNSTLELDVSVKQVFPANFNTFTLDFREAPLHEVLDAIVERMKNYTWSIQEGVVNIFPTRGRDPLLEELLGVKISVFRLGSSEQMRSVRTCLARLPEVVEFLNSKQTSVSRSRRGVFGPALGRKIGIDLNFSQLTFRQLLNGIASKKGGGWILKRRKDHNTDLTDYIDLDI